MLGNKNDALNAMGVILEEAVHSNDVIKVISVWVYRHVVHQKM